MQHLNNFQTVSPPTIPSQPTPESDTAHPRRSAYAAMSDLQEQFSAAGLETDSVWEFIKSEYKVESRSKLTGMQWARIAAELQGARRDDTLLKILIDSIPCHHFRIHVFTDDPTVCIGRPRDIGKHHIESEWGDFQAIANDNQCSLTVQQGKKTTFFEPKPVRPPAPVRTKSYITLNTNVRGEVMTAWGDVMAVQHDA